VTATLTCLQCENGAALFPGERCASCGGESDIPTQSAPQVDAVYVSQPTDQPATHRVKLATTVKRGRATLYVWECICGAASPLCESQGRANELYREHKA
jgi:hypothetical protein